MPLQIRSRRNQKIARLLPLVPRKGSLAALSILALAAIFCSAPSIAQKPPASPTTNPAAPPAGTRPDDHQRPPGDFLFPRAKIHPPTGEIPKVGQSVVFDASALGAPIVLDRNWRLGIAHSNDPAKPDFDDSAWPIRDAKEALAELDEAHTEQNADQPRPTNDPNANSEKRRQPHSRPFAWFRIRIQLPPQHGPLAIYVRLPVTRNSQIAINNQTVGLDLFANGKLINPEGPNGKNPEAFQQISRIYPIDIPAEQTSLVVAVRIPFVPFGLDAYTGFFANRTFLLGSGDDLRDHLHLWEHAVLFERLPALVDACIKFLLGFFLLALFYTQRDRREYLWLGLHLITVAPLAFFDIVGTTANLETVSMGALVIQFLLISGYFYFEFLVSFLALRRRWYLLALRFSAPLLLTFGPLLYSIHQSDAIAIGFVVSGLFATIWVLGWIVFTGITLTAATIKRNFEAALLLVPLLLSIVGMVELASVTATTSWMGTGPVQSPLTFQAGPVPIHFSAVADFAGIFVIILIIFVRFQRIHRERERASNELAAARSVQELMIPRESPKTPGFHVDTIYTPANEVGGDFFHINATGDGGLLVVIGDVAGHGLQAAMNVSMLMGALRRSPQTDPGKLLSALNEVLVGSSSLTTCQAAYFSANGELTVASAGHPPPYLNSQEVVLPGGLPLGVIGNIEYDETRLYLHPGDRLLMMSDGVAEARKPNGELFGFERVHNLSGQSAFFIAEAAKDFGQEDDITVLTVRRLPPPPPAQDHEEDVKLA